jgi:hypothetical protein
MRRVPALDAIRGTAIVLMVVDHVLAFRGAWRLWLWAGVVRLVFTRFALPAFMCVSGYLWGMRGVPSLRRRVEVLLVVPLSWWLSCRAGLGGPDVLALYAVVVWVSPLVVRFPLLAVVLGLLQAMNWRLSFFPGSYYPLGWVVAFCGLGVLWFDSVQAGRGSALLSCRS